MILRAVIAALIIALLMVACTVQRVPTECYAAPVPTTIRTKNKAFGWVPPPTTVTARGNSC